MGMNSHFQKVYTHATLAQKVKGGRVGAILTMARAVLYDASSVEENIKANKAFLLD